MKTPPPIFEIKNWLVKNNPLELFGQNFAINDIDPKPWSGHFNYSIELPDKKFILRFKGPEWGDTKGVFDEYQTLRQVEKFEVGPKVFYFSNDFFGEPVILQEYLEGKLVADMPKDEQDKLFGDITKFIYKINSIPFKPEAFPFQEPMVSYTKNKKAWRTRIEFILGCNETQTCGQELLAFLPGIESVLNDFEEHLQKVLRETGPVFIFESSHLGHCLKTNDGFRFFNWEQVSYGDPSYTLAVFLTSLHERPNFEEIKKEMIGAYLGQKNIPGFAKLVEQRILERHISNTIWNVYMGVKKGESVVFNWQENLEKILENIKGQR